MWTVEELLALPVDTVRPVVVGDFEHAFKEVGLSLSLSLSLSLCVCVCVTVCVCGSGWGERGNRAYCDTAANLLSQVRERGLCRLTTF